MTLKLTEKKVRKELEDAEESLSLFPQSHSRVAGVARCLRWLGDPEAARRFREAAEMVRPNDNPMFLLGLGNYLRLAGEEEKSRTHLERAYATYREEFALRGSSEPYMLDCAVFLGRDEELQEIAQKEGHDYLDVRLARARLNSDPQLAAQVTEEYAEDLRETRVRLGGSAPTTTEWDFYEIALRLRASLEEGSPNPDEATPLELSQWAAENPPPKPPPKKVRLTRDQAWEVILEGMGRNESADLQNTDLSGLDLSEADLSDAVLLDADLSSADLTDTELIDTNFRGANMKGVKLWGAEFQETDFEGADFTGTDLSGIEMWGVEMVRANLQRADLSGAELNHTNFEEANLRGANLSGANLSNADFTGAELTGADLRGAKLDETIFEGATMDDVLR